MKGEETMSTEQKLILVDHLDGGVSKLTLNNPPLNLVTLDLTRQLIEALEALDNDDSVRSVVITGAGDKAFCAGSDIKEFPDVSDQVVEKKLAKENEAFSRIERLTKPVIAAIEGIACGGGCEISLSCDLRIMAENAQIGLPEIKLGIFPGSGGLFRLPKLVGPSNALELMYLGDFIDAKEAYRIGLVNRIVPEGTAEAKAIELAQEIAKRPRESVKIIKQGVRKALTQSDEEAVQFTLDMSDRVFKTEDCKEGISAFFEKREPRFK